MSVRPAFFATERGSAVLGDSLDVLSGIDGESVDLIVTSPPFALVRKKMYGNRSDAEYVDWFKPFAGEFHRVLKDSGSLVLDLGGAWLPKQPTRSLYQFRLLLMLCDEFGFHLAQDFYWWQPSRLPAPAEWVTVRRIRVKDAVNTVWWLSKTPWPKASNRRVLVPYSDSQVRRIVEGETAKQKPSGHHTSETLGKDNGGSIPPNLLAFPNTVSNDSYLAYCRGNSIAPHPARFPSTLPEYFIRLLTDREDLVLDPFAGSCTTGEVCERLHRRWLCVEQSEEYLKGARGRFISDSQQAIFDLSSYEMPTAAVDSRGAVPYAVPNPAARWYGIPSDSLDGGQKRPNNRS